MKKLLALLTLLLFLFLVWSSWNWYKNTVLCCDEPVEEVVKIVGPLAFTCNSDQPITGDGWEAKKAEFISSLVEGEKLLIVAPYFDGETSDLGMSRAAKIEKLFLDKLSEDQIELHTYLAGNCEDAQTDPLYKTLFRSVVRNENVLELHDKAFIYFEYDKTKEIDTENVVKYLNTLAEEVKAGGQSIQLTGHTDHDGDQDYNYKLGLERAEHVKAYLVKQGVPEEKISVDSAGKLEPIADNSTEEGRQKNRRVEIEIK